jgi:dTDP-4-dehydrorhamnose reductase
MKIAVIGALGQLGTDISELFEKNGDDVIRLDVDEVDISDSENLGKCFTGINPEMVVNTAAFHHVEKCENDPITAFKVNAIGSRNLALLSREKNFYLVHISTDYVFDGILKQPYIESDRPVPLNVYGNTKLSGEHFIESIAEKYLILRTSGLYGKNPCRAKGGLNFVQLMLKLAGEGKDLRVVDSEILTPTSTIEVARQILKLSRNQIYGLAHATAEGQCSWYEFAREIFSISNVNAKLEVAAPGEFPAKVPRPTWSVLENKFLKDSGLNNFMHWKDSLREYLQ